MNDDKLEKRLQEVKRIILVQYILITALIILGAMVYGITTRQWPVAVKISAALIAVVSYFIPAIYGRAKHLARAFNEFH